MFAFRGEAHVEWSDKMDIENPSEPDSTTLERDVRQEFRKDEDVLCLNNKDGCFYLGTIVQVIQQLEKLFLFHCMQI